MGRLIKWIVYLLIILTILLVLYAYIGPFLGVDFSARSEDQLELITLQPE